MANYNYAHLWATPIHWSNMTTLDNTVLDYVKNELAYTSMSHGKANISVDKTVLDLDIFRDVKKEIEYHLDDYLFHNIGIRKDLHDGFYITRSWVNKMVKGNSAPNHSHTNSLFSGVLYLDMEENNSGGLLFTKPRNVPTISPQTFSFECNWNNLNASVFTFTPNINSIVLFPSHSAHMVLEYTGNIPRYSLAFNVFYRGELGNSQEEDYLEV